MTERCLWDRQASFSVDILFSVNGTTVLLADFSVPNEYMTNVYIRDRLAPFKLNRYGENLLFFLFYMNAGDVLQLAAAAEL